MKNLRNCAVCVFLTLMSVCAFAQNGSTLPLNEPDYNKPRLFDNLPEKIAVNINTVSNLFTRTIGDAVALGPSFSNQFQFDGQVVSTAFATDNNLQSVVVRSSNFIGAGFTITKVIDKDGSIFYRGRIVSLKSGDLYELQKEGDNYILVKKNFYDLINE